MRTTLDLDIGGSDVDGNGLEPNGLNYWVMRLQSLWTKNAGMGGTQDTKPEGARQSETSTSAGVVQDIVTVICNPFGRERGVSTGDGGQLASGSNGSQSLYEQSDDSSGLDVPYSASGRFICDHDAWLACCSVIFSPSISSELVDYVDGPGLLGVYAMRHATKITKFSPNLPAHQSGQLQIRPRSPQHE